MCYKCIILDYFLKIVLYWSLVLGTAELRWSAVLWSFCDKLPRLSEPYSDMDGKVPRTFHQHSLLFFAESLASHF